MTEISASILEVDPLSYYESIKEAVENGISLIHFDVTDGLYAKRISFGDRLVRSVLKRFDVKGEVHLMVSRPEVQVESFLDIEKLETVYFHPDSSSDPINVIRKIKDCDKKAGIVLSMNAQANIDLLREADAVLLLLVKPGEGGQKLDVNGISKIEELKLLRKNLKLNFTIAADGGIKPDNAKEVAEAGADVLVIGTGIFYGNIAENIRRIKEHLS